MSDLVAADPLPRALAWLSAHPDLTAEIGASGRVGAYNEPPYPRLRILDTPGGDDRDLTWLIAVELQVEALGDLDGSPGKAQLRRILYTALGLLRELPGQAPEPGDPVITHVGVSRSGGWVPEPSGQPRYLAAVRLWSHPPN